MIGFGKEVEGSLDFERDIFVLWKWGENETHSCIAAYDWGVPLLALFNS